ncbi:hypothetical protein F4814DRAFT_409130 [Daldinia grandis]|nr:hypothetical protein F4814DRAFT_409130 [Daldinia grandis]
MEPNSDSDTEYPVARKRHAGNLVFSTRTSQLELDSDDDGDSDSNNDSDGNDDGNEVKFNDDDSFSSYSLFFSDDDNDDDSISGESDAEHNHATLEIKTKPKLSCSPANPDLVPELSISVASLSSSNRSSSRNGDHVSGTPIAVPINSQGPFRHISDDHVHLRMAFPLIYYL